MKRKQPVPPQSVGELLSRARDIAGCTIGELARKSGVNLPENLLHAKGWLGQLIETYLGADAGSLAQPDFQQLGIELKTLPVLADGTPKESTYVCVLPMLGEVATQWQDSWVYRKLKHVLWFPYEADPAIPVEKRRLGSAILWKLQGEDERILRQDWEELIELVSLGQIDRIDARLGTYLQVRPKAANSRQLVTATDEEGNPAETLPRGFYLRTCFTRKILEQHYALLSG